MDGIQRPFDPSTCARPNILALQAYRCARDDYKDDGTNVLLDANENAYGPALDLDSAQNPINGDVNGHGIADPMNIDFLGLNRYPDPYQNDLKQNTRKDSVKLLKPENLFVGVGSDEAIWYCVVSVDLEKIRVVRVNLDESKQKFELRPDAVNEELCRDPSIKVVFVCSPGNPTGNLISKTHIQRVLEHPTWNGVVVVDEAYIDFSPPGSSLAEWVSEWPNLIVMQTLSKAFGLAGIRLGAAFASPSIAELLNKLKAPYNISSPTSALACTALQPKNLGVMKRNMTKIVEQRDRMLQELPKVPGIGRFLGGTASNFLLVELLDKPRDQNGNASNVIADAVYERLAETKRVVTRFRGKEFGCEGCLRITVGTEMEVDTLLRQLRDVLEEVYTGKNRIGKGEQDEREREANGVIS